MRFVPETPEEPAHRLLHALELEGLEIGGWFSVMTATDVRQRPFPD
jgi:hypothetical protein